MYYKLLYYIIIINLSESENEEEDYCKSARVGNFWSNDYIEFESNGDRN